MFLILLLLFTLIPALEFYLLFSVGSQIGAFNTFGIIIFTGVFGAYLSKSQGLIVLQKIQNELAGGALPAKEIVHGFLLFGGGLLLLTPGFLTDAIGFAFVIPGSRHIIVEALLLYFKSAVKKGSVKFSTFSFSQSNQNTKSGGFHFENMSGHSEIQDPDIIETEFKRKD